MELAVRTLLQITLTMSIVSGILMLLLPLLTKHYRPKGIYYSLVILLLGFLIPFRPVFHEPALTLPLPIPSSLQSSNFTTNLTTKPETAIVPYNSSGISINPIQILFIIWMVGAVVALSVYLINHIKFMRIVNRWGKIIHNNAFNEVFAEEKQALGIHRNINFKCCPPVGTAMLIGFIKPTILIPDLKLSKMEIQLIIRHELIHYVRRDLWVRFLTMIVLVVHWFNPFVYLLVKTLTFYCESSCDSEVIMDFDLDIRQYYSKMIINVIRRKSNLNTTLSTSFYSGKNGMKRRISSIMNIKRKKLGLIMICCVMIITLGTGMAFAFNNTQNKNMDLSNKSENYKVIAKMASLPKNISVAEYTKKIDEICDNSGKEFFALLADVSEEIDSNDPLYEYYTNTLSHTSSEKFADIIGGSETYHSFGYAIREKYGANPVREDYYTDAEWALIQEQGPELIYFFNAYYVLVYDIPNKTSITIAERDKMILDTKADIQAYWDGLSESELQNDNLKQHTIEKINEISQKHNNSKIKIQGELQSIESSLDDFSK